MYEAMEGRVGTPRPIRPARVAALAAAALCGSVLVGCAPRVAADGFASAPVQEDVVLRVENQTQETMRIYLLMDGTLHNVGRVEGLQRGRFSVGHLLEGAFVELRIEAAPVRFGAERWTSDRLTLEMGEELHVVVRNHLPQSTFSVVPRHLVRR